MAGHSHWANIKRKKGAIDAKRGQVWGKIAKKIMIAAKGGGDPRDNLSLRYIIDEAKAANMPRHTIENAVAKGSGGGGGDGFEEVVYEGYGPGGVAVVVEALTNNRARTAPEMRQLFDRAGGSLGTSGSVAFQFAKQGIFTIKSDGVDEEALMTAVLDAGAEDLRDEGEVFEVLTPVEKFHLVKEAIDAAGVATEDAAIAYLAQNTIEVTDRELAEKVLRLVDALEDNEDVQTVSHNAEIDESVTV